MMSDKKPNENLNTPEMKKVAPPPMKKEVKTPEIKKEETAPVKAAEKAPAEPTAEKTPVKATAEKAVKKGGAAAAGLIEKIKANKKVILTVVPIIIAVVVIAIVLAVVLKNVGKNPTSGKTPEFTNGPIYVTDENGIAVTDENGVAITIEAETTIVKVTDADGNVLKDQNGKPVTTVVYKDVNYNYYVPVTDKNGVSVTDENGVPVTEAATLIQDPNKQNGALVMGTTIINVTDGQGNTAVDQNGNVLTTIANITSNPVTVAPADLQWKASMGGTEADYFSSIASVSDGFLAVNVTNSLTGDMKEFESLGYATPYSVVVKYNDDGDLVWRKAIGSKRGLNIFTDIIPLSDGSFYAVGHAVNPGGDKGKGYYDGVVYKFDSKCNEIWHKSFGTSTVDTFNAGALTDDGGIVVVGSVGNNDGDAKGFGKAELQSACVVVKYTSDGTLAWKNVVGGNTDVLNDVAVASDGSVFCVGNFASGDLFKSAGKTDSGLIKFNSNGKYVNIAPISGKGVENFYGITSCKNGGVVVVGRSDSNDTDANVSMFTGDLGSRGGFDAYIMKFNEDLSIVFAKPFRGQYNDNLVDIVEKEDGTFVATGDSNSSTRDFKGITTRGGKDIVIASFDKHGNLTWARSFGGTANESAEAICLSDKGGYVIAGKTESKNIDMVGIAQYVNGRGVGVVAKFPE